MQERGSAWCDWCLADFPAAGVDVDHVRPLSLGGEDVDSNVQVLCHGYHGLKARTESGAAGALNPVRPCCPPRLHCSGSRLPHCWGRDYPAGLPRRSG
ncbi:HNH endonuclease signature motif containing protein [Streptomyces sp. MBT27]|uniref:HNH endonuclease n=1 Tax=Streptomyces sp. MBT27 TaxID=1488356 RepID=UPI0031FE4D39